MDYIEPIALTLAGLWTGSLWVKLRNTRALLAMETEKKVDAANEFLAAMYALSNLRRNCFLTNERGHRVRYADASVAVRERAEGATSAMPF